MEGKRAPPRHLLTSLFASTPAIPRSPTIAVNLDFANDRLPYDCAVNVFDLISLSDVMEAYELGPNGGASKRQSPPGQQHALFRFFCFSLTAYPHPHPTDRPRAQGLCIA